MSERSTGSETLRRDSGFEPIPATDAQLESLAQMIRDRSARPATSRRKEPRHELGFSIVRMRAEIPGGGRLRRCIGAYDLSRRGLAALVRGAPPASSPLRLWLRDRDGLEEEVAAEIRWIRAVTDRYQAMGVRFTRPIEVERYI